MLKISIGKCLVVFMFFLISNTHDFRPSFATAVYLPFSNYRRLLAFNECMELYMFVH